MSQCVARQRRRIVEPLKAAIEKGHRRYFDPSQKVEVVRVLPGDHYVCTNKTEMIVTVLGSCVSACIRDTLTGIGGMNHFMLPQSVTGDWGAVSANMRYGNFAMETLINDILKTGCPRERLEVKLFGGSNVTHGNVKVGDMNGEFAKTYMEYEGLSVKACDLGGIHPRRIHYFPETGKVDRLLLRRVDDASYLKEENEYLTRIPNQMSRSGKIDLF